MVSQKCRHFSKVHANNLWISDNPVSFHVGLFEDLLELPNVVTKLIGKTVKPTNLMSPNIWNFVLLELFNIAFVLDA